jgi:hypothetical protein
MREVNVKLRSRQWIPAPRFQSVPVFQDLETFIVDNQDGCIAGQSKSGIVLVHACLVSPHNWVQSAANQNRVRSIHGWMPNSRYWRRLSLLRVTGLARSYESLNAPKAWIILFDRCINNGRNRHGCIKDADCHWMVVFSILACRRQQRKQGRMAH